MDLPNWQSLERVGRPDFRAATGQLVLGDFIRHLRNLILPMGRANGGETNYDSRVIRGFDWTTTVTGAVGALVMNRGVGLFPYLDPDDGQIKHAILFADEGAETISVDFSGATDPGTTDVFVRLVRTPATFANRVFWNPSGAPAQEYVSNIPTRLVFQWEVTIQDTGLPAPGDEWVKVWEITIAAGNFTGSEDFRHFYFEGSANSTDNYDQEWGDGANDRNSDRAQYGVNDIHEILQAIRRQLDDAFLTGDGWYQAINVALGHLATEHHGYASVAGSRGFHKLIRLGQLATASTTRVCELDGDDAFFLVKLANAPNGQLAEMLLQEAGAAEVRWGVAPRGGAPMSNGDELVGILGDYSAMEDVQLRVQKTATTSHVARITAGNGLINGLDVYMGTAAAIKGSVLREAESAYYVNQRQVYINLDWSSIVTDIAGSRRWHLDGPVNGDVGLGIGGDVTLKTIGARSGNEPLFLEFKDFPDEATLDAIDVTWSQGGVGAANEMRMYAARHIQTWAEPTDAHDQSSDEAFTWTTQVLNSVQNYVQYVLNVQTTQTRRFKPNQNNTSWDRRRHKLVLGIVPPDTLAQTCTILNIRTRWTYSNAQPWPRRTAA